MNPNDVITGCFELVGAFMLSLNVRTLYRDKEVKGAHWAPIVFFDVWGLWNLWFYPAMGLWFSLFGGLFITLMNTTWLILYFYYTRRKLK